MLKMRVNNNMRVETEMVQINTRLSIGMAVDNDTMCYITIQENLNGVALKTLFRMKLESAKSLIHNLTKSIIGCSMSEEYEDIDMKMTMLTNVSGGTKEKKTISGIGSIDVVNGIGGSNCAILNLVSDNENLKHVFNVNRQVSREIINIINHVTDEVERYSF